MVDNARVSGTIKALEWEARTDILGLHNAKGCDGYWYNVQQVADGVFVYEGHPADMPDHVGSKHPSLIAAKAGAQADYEARILAAIQTDPEPQPVFGEWVDDKTYHEYPSSAGTVSVEAVSKMIDSLAPTVASHAQMQAALRTLAGEGER